MIIFLLLLYLFVGGVLTLLESNIIGLVQSSLSNYKFNIFGIFQFFLDFFKLFNNVILYDFNMNVYKSFTSTFMFFTSNILFILFVVFYIKVKDYFILSFVSLVLFSFLNLVVNVICSNYFSSNYISCFILSLKIVLIIVENLLTFIDLGYIIIFSLDDLFIFLLYNGFEFNLLFFMIVILFVINLVSSFSCPFDFIESESECLNSLFINVIGLEYALWTLFEYLSIMNSYLYFIVILNVSFGFGLVICFVLFIFILLVVCFISAMLISFSISLLFSIILSFLVLFSIFIILFIIF